MPLQRVSVHVLSSLDLLTESPALGPSLSRVRKTAFSVFAKSGLRWEVSGGKSSKRLLIRSLCSR